MKMHSHYEKEKLLYNELSYESKYLLDPKYMTKRDLRHFYRYYNMTKNRSQCKKVIIIVFCFCFFCYIFVDYNLRTKLIHLRDRFDFIARIDADYNVTQAYFVNTPGCRMPFFEVIDNNIIQFMFKPESFSCKKSLIRTSDVGAQLLLNMNKKELSEYYNITSLENVNCQYTEIQRKTDEKNLYLVTIPFTLEFNKPIDVKPGIEFISVECFDKDLRMFYKDFHFFAVKKNVLENEKIEATETVSTNKKFSKFYRVSFSKVTSHNSSNDNKTSEDERVSVMVLGIDSVSHLNFLRQMVHTASYIQQKLTHVEFWGFNKVGDNTYPNLVPMLSGLDETELNISCLAPVKQSNFDSCAFIWKRYKEYGFKTVYAEDVGKISLFNYFRPGFNQQPTDYYLRPIMLEMEEHISEKKKLNVELCMGGRRTADVILEYIQKLVPFMRKENFFSFFWTATLTHDLLNTPKLLDQNFLELFEFFEAKGIFNKTVIFLMSDHGLRWGSFRKTYQGMMEERQPLLIIVYPKWFKQKYPKAVKNLEINSRRLTTHYDLYATMTDLVNLRNLEDKFINTRAIDLTIDTDLIPRAISLFLPIPLSRSCENAGIASHWCTCHQRKDLQTNDGRVQRAARYIVKLINERLRLHPQCRVLYLNSILEAIVAAPHTKIIRELTNDYGIDITVRIQTKPGLAIFESTVRMSSYSTSLIGTISRINLYGSQSYCIDDYALKMFCYCHR